MQQKMIDVGSLYIPTQVSLVIDSTGNYAFCPDSLSSVPTYDGSGNMITLTVGPDANGNSFRQTSTWTNGVWMGDSAWVKL